MYYNVGAKGSTVVSKTKMQIPEILSIFLLSIHSYLWKKRNTQNTYYFYNLVLLTEEINIVAC